MVVERDAKDRAMLMRLQQLRLPIQSITTEHLHHYDNLRRLKNVNERDEMFKREMRDLEEMLSKLNPMAKEFVPPSRAAASNMTMMKINDRYNNGGNNVTAGFCSYEGNRAPPRGKRNGYGEAKRRVSNRTIMAQREDTIRRTVYVSDIDHQITEQQLAAVFVGCGQVVDCRICGSPKSVLRFAFVEFTDREAARAATNLSGIILGYYPLKVFPSKTAIAPVNPTYLPQTLDEREMCARTVYVTNIDKKVSQAQVKLFFETVCGEVYQIRLLGDYHHPSRIAFVEFAMAESAIGALNCSGVVMGSLPIRVSPSKTPVRPRPSHPPTH